MESSYCNASSASIASVMGSCGPNKGGLDRCSVTRGWGGVSPEGLKFFTILAGPTSVQFGYQIWNAYLSYSADF